MSFVTKYLQGGKGVNLPLPLIICKLTVFPRNLKGFVGDTDTLITRHGDRIIHAEINKHLYPLHPSNEG